jgi:hypothetical protein
MFAARQRPLLVLEDRLLALRPSLNTPVLATAEIPSGPARAAIFVYAEGAVRRFGVAVHAAQSAAAVVYELAAEHAPTDADGWSVALDATLSFGESMGFVFDDEMLTDRQPETLRRAMATLRALLAPGVAIDDTPAPGASTMEIGSADDLAEILLEDELDSLSPEAPDGGPDATGPIDAAPPTVPIAAAAVPVSLQQQARPEPIAPPPAAFAPGVALSKFRSAPASAARPQPAPESPTEPAQSARGAATLGRVKPRKVRADGEPATGREPLLRLLADF